MNLKCPKLFYFIKTVKIGFAYLSLSPQRDTGKEIKTLLDFPHQGIYLPETPVASRCFLESLFYTKKYRCANSLCTEGDENLSSFFLFLASCSSIHPQSPLGAVVLSRCKAFNQGQ